ncbi:hypothetical protein FQN60_008352, partial [Etheostoma spectabile]
MLQQHMEQRRETAGLNPMDKGHIKSKQELSVLQPPKLTALTLDGDDPDLHHPQLLQSPEPLLTWLPYQGVKLQHPAASTSEEEGMSKQHMALPCQSHACKWSTLT